ncbi:hypothetical protein [Nocardia brasiliensis]|uniref:hypothetical protein n=1 Tax=Nocardia brasiliensis TaxID=37326 RepID=UPI002453D9D8|nr:hypothetical protein [Nocardia brasiliensis]
MDLLDYFRGIRPWRQLYRFLKQLPMDSHYQSAVAMNPEIGAQLAKQKRPEKFDPPTPQGYTLPILLQLKMIDLVKELMRLIPAVFSGKVPPPMKPEPRPMTAADLIRERAETEAVYEALDLILGKK